MRKSNHSSPLPITEASTARRICALLSDAPGAGGWPAALGRKVVSMRLLILCIDAYLNRRVRNAMANVKYISDGIAIFITYARPVDGTASPAVFPDRRRRAPVHARGRSAAYPAAAVVTAD